MKIEKIVTEQQLVCDACEVDLEHTADYIEIGSIDLCYLCSSKILENLNVPEEKAKPWVLKLRETLHKDTYFKTDRPMEEVNDIFKKPDEPVRYVYKDTGPPYPTSTFDRTTGITETLQTTGVDQMILVSSIENNLSVPTKTVSSLTNLGDL